MKRSYVKMAKTNMALITLSLFIKFYMKMDSSFGIQNVLVLLLWSFKLYIPLWNIQLHKKG